MTLEPCACGRPFVPDHDLYMAHVQTPEHQRWRLEVIERGEVWARDELAFELFGLVLPRENAPEAPCVSAR